MCFCRVTVLIAVMICRGDKPLHAFTLAGLRVERGFEVSDAPLGLLKLGTPPRFRLKLGCCSFIAGPVSRPG